jgi:hypothetical protein
MRHMLYLEVFLLGNRRLRVAINNWNTFTGEETGYSSDCSAVD